MPSRLFSYILLLSLKFIGGGGGHLVQWDLDDGSAEVESQCLLDLLDEGNDIRQLASSMLASSNSIYHGLHQRSCDGVPLTPLLRRQHHLEFVEGVRHDPVQPQP